MSFYVILLFFGFVSKTSSVAAFSFTESTSATFTLTCMLSLPSASNGHKPLCAMHRQKLSPPPCEVEEDAGPAALCQPESLQELSLLLLELLLASTEWWFTAGDLHLPQPLICNADVSLHPCSACPRGSRCTCGISRCYCMHTAGHVSCSFPWPQPKREECLQGGAELLGERWEQTSQRSKVLQTLFLQPARQSSKNDLASPMRHKPRTLYQRGVPVGRETDINVHGHNQYLRSICQAVEKHYKGSAVKRCESWKWVR